MTESTGQRRSRLALAGLLTVTGVLHIVARSTFEAIIPRWVPGDPAVVNLAATAAELGSAALLVRESTARAGGMAAFVTFAVVWVANLQHAIEGGIPGAPGWIGSPMAAWIRAPLQVPLLWWAWRISRRGGPLSRPS